MAKGRVANRQQEPEGWADRHLREKAVEKGH